MFIPHSEHSIAESSFLGCSWSSDAGKCVPSVVSIDLKWNYEILQGFNARTFVEEICIGKEIMAVQQILFRPYI